jgi:predicted neuraminidase
VQHPAIVSAAFIFDEAPFPQCHASTIVQTQDALVAAWFGGPREKHPDVGIWVSRNEGTGWSPPVEVANGVQNSGKRYPTWNPVLFQPKAGPVQLFFKIGPSPSGWWGMLTTSDDQGRTWSSPRRLPKGHIGPAKNKPIQLPNGDVLVPSSSEHDGWRIHFDRISDPGQNWEHMGPVNDSTRFSAIQPSLLTHENGRIQALSRSRQGKILESWSNDGGRTWTALTETPLPNPNSGIDAVTLADGRQLLVYNHATIPEGSSGGPRSPLNVAISVDGVTWQAALTLEDAPGEYSYPAVIQAADGLVHITYTWKRTRIRHVVIDPAKLDRRPMPNGMWPE